MTSLDLIEETQDGLPSSILESKCLQSKAVSVVLVKKRTLPSQQQLRLIATVLETMPRSVLLVLSVLMISSYKNIVTDWTPASPSLKKVFSNTMFSNAE